MPPDRLSLQALSLWENKDNKAITGRDEDLSSLKERLLLLCRACLPTTIKDSFDKMEDRIDPLILYATTIYLLTTKTTTWCDGGTAWGSSYRNRSNRAQVARATLH